MFTKTMLKMGSYSLYFLLMTSAKKGRKLKYGKIGPHSSKTISGCTQSMMGQELEYNII